MKDNKKIRMSGYKAMVKKGIDTIKSVKKEIERVSKRKGELDKECKRLDGEYSYLNSREREFKILGLPIGSAVRFNAVYFGGKEAKIGSKEMTLKEIKQQKKRETGRIKYYAVVECEGKRYAFWCDRLVPAKECNITKDLQNMGKEMGKIFNSAIEGCAKC